jgi:DNA-binding NarL/FixJ family response regulator
LTSPRPSIRIVLAGEHPIFRDGLRQLLGAEPDFTIVGDEPDGAKAETVTRDADVLLLGFASSGRRLVDTVRALQTSTTSIRTILLTDRIDRPEVSPALELGLRGVVLRDATPDVLFASIRCVHAGGIWLGQSERARPEATLRQAAAVRRRAHAFGLTPREVEVIRAVVAGCSNREIARRSGISENTVKSHLTNIYNKCGASTRVELALFAAHHRLTDGV